MLRPPTGWFPLEHAWECEYLELEPDLYEFMKPTPIPMLAGWSFDRRRLHGWAAYLHRSFHLPEGEIESCSLYIDQAPSPARLYINHRHADTYIAPGLDDPPYEQDIRAFVTPGRNHIAFRVEASSRGNFQGISIACRNLASASSTSRRTG